MSTNHQQPHYSPTSVASMHHSHDPNQPSLKTVSFNNTLSNNTEDSSVPELSIAFSNMSAVKRYGTTPSPPALGSGGESPSSYLPKEISPKGSYGAALSCTSSWGDAPSLWSGNMGTKSFGTSTTYLDDPHTAPPPVLSFPKDRLESGAVDIRVNAGKMPSYDKIRHSGYIMTRFSAGELLAKKWTQNFWILYGDRFYFFKSKEDFEVWLLNPSLTYDEREDLVNFRLSLFDKATLIKYQYRLGSMNVKLYANNGNLHRFKLTKHSRHGLTRSSVVCGAFASMNEIDVIELYNIIESVMKMGPSTIQEEGHQHAFH